LGIGASFRLKVSKIKVKIAHVMKSEIVAIRLFKLDALFEILPFRASVVGVGGTTGEGGSAGEEWTGGVIDVMSLLLGDASSEWEECGLFKGVTEDDMSEGLENVNQEYMYSIMKDLDPLKKKVSSSRSSTSTNNNIKVEYECRRLSTSAGG
jgi:hypothetical protein